MGGGGGGRIISVANPKRVPPTPTAMEAEAEGLSPPKQDTRKPSLAEPWNQTKRRAGNAATVAS